MGIKLFIWMEISHESKQSKKYSVLLSGHIIVIDYKIGQLLQPASHSPCVSMHMITSLSVCVGVNLYIWTCLLSPVWRDYLNWCPALLDFFYPNIKSIDCIEFFCLLVTAWSNNCFIFISLWDFSSFHSS